MIKMNKFFIILSAILIYQTSNCSADTVTFKNKQSMEGVITEEAENYIILDIGCGTITLPRTDIDSIKKSSSPANTAIVENWKKQYFENYSAPTQEDQKLLDEFKELQSEKSKLTGDIARKDRVIKEISMTQRKIPELQEEQNAIGRNLKSTDAVKDILKYNNLVIELNLAGSKLREAVDRIRELQGEQEKIDSRLTDYINRFMDFREMIAQRKKEIASEKTNPEQNTFYNNLKEKFDELQKDIKYQEVGFTKCQEGVVVAVSFNGKVDAMMVVDTGAALTVISENLAARLEIAANKVKQDIELILADGSRIPAKFVILDSLKVGGAEAKSVGAAIVKVKIPNGVDGFLGMSFLKNFSFSMDMTKQKLILSRFK